MPADKRTAKQRLADSAAALAKTAATHELEVFYAAIAELNGEQPAAAAASSSSAKSTSATPATPAK